ncbi:hypothetical protein [Streptomyces sp. 2P-4]|uniref:hypothetical protein n=1 Tax=Streptomyces sp. 2P-4 TaxID=2931974 RepID=UPI0025409AE8|nr:hypothetical protein [Streptomyces sp. 2P-4]
MTRAEALALAAGGGLRENCVVVLHTDTPTIGTAGNTSPTEIELNPVSPTAFGQTARVLTTFAPEAWPGIYDLAANKITELRDDFGNTVKDVDADAATVHTQWPWHLGSATLRDNYAEDAVLTAMGAQVGAITNCRFVGSTVDFTGKTAGAWTDTEVTGGATVTTGANMVATRSTITAATVSNAGAGTFTLTDSSVLDATTTLTITGTAAGNKTLSGGTVIRDRFRMNITGTGNVTLTASTFLGRLAGTSEAELGGGGILSIFRTRVTPYVTAGPALDFAGNGNATLIDGDMSESRIQTAAGSTSSLNLTTFTFRRSNGVTVAATGTGSVTMQQGNYIAGGGIAQNGAAVLQMNACRGNVFMVGAAGATRGLTVTGCFGAQFNITQNGTGSTNTDSVLQSSGMGTTTINLNSALAGTPSQSFVRLALTNGATLNVEDPALPQPIDNSTIETQATVNVQPGGTFVRCRVAGESTLNTGPHSHVSSVIEGGQFTKTSTGANVGRLVNKAFDDWV